jgi:hypothetical protein
MKSDHRWLLPPDPQPREAIAADGDVAEVVEASKPAVIRSTATAPLLTMQLADLKEENTLLRSTLHGLAALLHKIADSVGTDLAEAEAKARIEADRRRRF